MTNQNHLINGKIILVTGATGGIGEWTANKLAAQGAQVVIHGRNPERCAAAVERIRGWSGNPAVESLAADLSSQAEVRRLAQEFRQRYPRLDVLVNNAGAFFLRRHYSVDGIEMTFAVNHFSYFLLTLELLDVLKASAPARIVNVASNSHWRQRLDFAHLDGGWFYQGWKAYGQSKLANILFTYELARRLENEAVPVRVTVNALHPGFVATNIGKNNGLLAQWFVPVFQRNALTPEQGAETSIYLASSPAVEGVSGKYFIDSREVPSSSQSYDREAAAQLWQVSEGLTGKVYE
jgi:NAD(P)-dependent dehydrogenase (short-subunit alcohol dehydrogenase family)